MCWYESSNLFLNNDSFFTADPLWDKDVYDKEGFEYGACVNIDKKVQDKGTSIVGKNQRPQNCIDLCRGEPGITGCEMEPSKPKRDGGTCIAHTKEVFGGSNIRDKSFQKYCFNFQNQSRTQKYNGSFLIKFVKRFRHVKMDVVDQSFLSWAWATSQVNVILMPFLCIRGLAVLVIVSVDHQKNIVCVKSV